ncbi:MAG: PAS domain-containing protein [Parvibaculum sp.]
MSSFISEEIARSPDEKATVTLLDAPVLPELRHLLAYWESKRGTRAYPDRADIRPEEFRRLLPHIGIVEVLDGGADFRFRLFGEELFKITGFDRKGEKFSEMKAAPDSKLTDEVMRTRWSETMRAVLQLGGPLSLKTPMARTEGEGPLEMHVLLLPVTTGGEEIGQILGAIFVVPREE